MSNLVYLGAGLDIYPCFLLPEVDNFLFIDRGDDDSYFKKYGEKHGKILNIIELAKKLKFLISSFYNDAVVDKVFSEGGLKKGYLKIKFNGDHILEYYTDVKILPSGKIQYLSTRENSVEISKRIYNDSGIMYICGYEPEPIVLEKFITNNYLHDNSHYDNEPEKTIIIQKTEKYGNLRTMYPENIILYLDLFILMRTRQIFKVGSRELKKMISWYFRRNQRDILLYYNHMLDYYGVNNVDDLYNILKKGNELHKADDLFNIVNGEPFIFQSLEDAFFNDINKTTIKIFRDSFEDSKIKKSIKNDEFEIYDNIYKFDNEILKELLKKERKLINDSIFKNKKIKNTFNKREQEYIKNLIDPITKNKDFNFYNEGKPSVQHRLLLARKMLTKPKLFTKRTSRTKTKTQRRTRSISPKRITKTKTQRRTRSVGVNTRSRRSTTKAKRQRRTRSTTPKISSKTKAKSQRRTKSDSLTRRKRRSITKARSI